MAQAVIPLFDHGRAERALAAGARQPGRGAC